MFGHIFFRKTGIHFSGKCFDPPTCRDAVMARFAPFLFLLLLLLGSETAHAHAVLLDTAPADGAVLATAPTEVTFRFNEPVSPVTLRVLSIDARPIADGSD